MKDIKKSNKRNPRKSDLPNHSINEMAVRIPKDFYFVLLEKLVHDLRDNPSPSGDFPVLAHPDINLSGVLSAVRARDMVLLMKETNALSIQSILERWADQPEKAFGLYQLHTLLKKLPLSNDGGDTGKTAYATFQKYEAHCERFNRENWKRAKALNVKHPDYLGFIEEIRADIHRLLGEGPDLSRIYDSARHGPGTAVGLSTPMVTSFFKWSSWPYSVSPAALPYAREAIERDPRWIGALLDSYRRRKNIPMWAPISMDAFWDDVFKLTDYCQYGTVPKTSETDRSIGIEPTLNVFLQLGVDGVIRRKLKHQWGIDLNSQSRNQWLAWASSISNDDATIDLKGASDCVAYMAAFLLLPLGWFNLLDDLRSKNIRVGKSYFGGKVDDVYPLHKLSAMGNGYTFVLETVIFAAIARFSMRRAKVKGNLSVFGDDIILPRQAAPVLYEFLDIFGFMVNEDKSFVTGPFRESCGVDCLSGINIRPLFLKQRVTDVTDIWYIHNSLMSLEDRLPELWEVRFTETIEWLRRFIPVQYRKVVGPVSQSLDTYRFERRTKYDVNGLVKHLALVPMPLNFNHRAPEFFFRKLMATLLGRSTSVQERLETSTLDRLLGITVDYQSGWETGGHVRDNQRTSTSCFDVTLRDVVKHSLTTVRSWRS